MAYHQQTVVGVRTDKYTTNEHTLFLISLFTSSLFDHSIFSCNFALFILAYFLLFLTTSFMLLFAAFSDVCAFFLLRYFRYNCYFHSHDTLPKNFIIHNFQILDTSKLDLDRLFLPYALFILLRSLMSVFVYSLLRSLMSESFV